jgi:hypothetical protein
MGWHFIACASVERGLARAGVMTAVAVFFTVLILLLVAAEVTS